MKINGRSIEVEEDITIIEAAESNHINIPSLCFLKNIHQKGACRICVVEVEGSKNLMAACTTKVRPDMVVHTNTKKLREYRKVIY